MKKDYSKIHILVIDDEPDMLSGFTSILSAYGYSSYPFTNARKAITLLESEQFDLIFCDLLMNDINGMDVVKAAQKSAPNTPLIIFSAYGTIERAVQAMKEGAFDFLEKPIDTQKLQLVIEKGLRQRDLYKERNNLLDQLQDKYGFDNIVGKSDEMQKIFRMIESISRTDANVLITGESGTGKELIARSIHAHSSRKTKPFVPINCGALPEHLFEAELFGYEKGSFTGAMNRKLGLLEYANQGTFFLDEVCEMHPNLQVKLLRVLQDHHLRRLGGNELIKIDFRIISATNRDLEKVVESEQMRKDFYYRLNVIHINLPPLRERKDDIFLLADHFLQKNNLNNSKNIAGFTDEVKTFLENYSWPGNVRELENVIERAVALAKTELITKDELPDGLRIKNRLEFNDREKLPLIETKQQTMFNIERKYLLSLLEKHNGNITRISEEAGMTRRNVHRLLKIHNIDPDIWRK